MTIATDRDRLVFFHDADVTARSPEVLGQITADMEVVVPHYPGFEGSFEALDRAWEAWDGAVDLAHHFRRTVIDVPDDPVAPPVHLAGAGFGGWVALELALMAPRLVRSLVLVAPYGVKLAGPTDREFADVLLLDAHEQLELGWADPSRCTGIRMPGFPAELPDAEQELAFAERATLARYAWKPFLHSRGLSRWFHTIDIPTLVIVGAQDRMLSEGHSRTLAERMPRARYVEIPDAGHYPYLEQPEAFQTAVAEFYAEVQSQLTEARP